MKYNIFSQIYHKVIDFLGRNESANFWWTLFFLCILIVVLIYVSGSIGQMLILRKGGYPEWQGWVPFLGSYRVCEIACGETIAVIYLCAKLAVYPINVIPVLIPIIQLFSWFMKGYKAYCLSKAFGKDTGYAVGLFFLPRIFELILGFGSAEYFEPYIPERLRQYLP